MKVRPIPITKCGCKYCEQGLAYVIGDYMEILKCQCGATCGHWGVKKERTKPIHMNHKLLKYLKWLYKVGEKGEDLEGFYSSLSLYREILKTNYTAALKVTNTIETITNKLITQFRKDDVIKFCEKNDVSFMEEAMKELFTQKVKFFGFEIDADVEGFVRVLKPLLYPYVQYVQIMRVLELKRPEVYRYLISNKERTWWMVECCRKLNEYVKFEPVNLMLSIDEIFGTQFKEEESDGKE